MNKKRNTKGTAYKQFVSLTPSRRDAEVARYDREDLSPGMPLNAADRAQHRRAAARAKRGRPRIGRGSKMIPVTIERGLLKEVDSYAKQHGYKRSQMVAQGLRLVMQRPIAKAG